ncbi:hypothetical protein GCM10009605_13300 [Nocardiopsis composta]
MAAAPGCTDRAGGTGAGGDGGAARTRGEAARDDSGDTLARQARDRWSERSAIMFPLDKLWIYDRPRFGCGHHRWEGNP